MVIEKAIITAKIVGCEEVYGIYGEGQWFEALVIIEMTEFVSISALQQVKMLPIFQVRGLVSLSLT